MWRSKFRNKKLPPQLPSPCRKCPQCVCNLLRVEPLHKPFRLLLHLPTNKPSLGRLPIVAYADSVFVTPCDSPWHCPAHVSCRFLWALSYHLSIINLIATYYLEVRGHVI